MTKRFLVSAFAGFALAATVAPAEGQSGGAPLEGLGVEERLEAGPILASTLDRLAIAPGALPLFVRLHVGFASLGAMVESERWDQLDERLARYATYRAGVLIAIDDPPADLEESETWRRVLGAAAAHGRGRVAGYEIGGPPAGSPLDAQGFAFLLKLAAVQIRAADEQALIATTVPGPAAASWLSRLYDQDTEAYLDLVVVDSSGTAAPDDFGEFAGVVATMAARDPTAQLLVGDAALASAPDRAAREWVGLTLAHLGTPLSRVAVTADADALAAVLGAASRVADVLSGEVVALDDQAASVHFAVGGRDVTAEIPHRLLYNPSTLATYLVYRSEITAATLDVTLVDPNGRQPVLRDAVTGQTAPVADFSWDQTAGRSRMTVPSSPDTQLITFSPRESSRFGTNERVVASALPSVSEIVFREQQTRAAEDARYVRYIALVRLEQHFRPSPTDAFDVVTTNRFYVDGAGSEWEELSFSLNGNEWGADRPPFPLLQAEKVLSLPLDVRLTNDYDYRLEGVEDVEGRPSFVVRFEPVDETLSLYRGRMWIDAETYRRIKVTTVQTQMAAPVVSSEETQWYSQVAIGTGQTVTLVTRVSTKQIFLIAGRNLLMEKEAVWSDFQMDPPDFEARRLAAHASDRIMFRDTDLGVRYLAKRGSERVVSDRITTSVKALAMGTTVDPSFDFPLPIFGLNYLNFDFLGRNSQVAVLFGGVLALANLQFPKLGRTPLDASIDIFAIAVPGNDIVFGDTGERTDERMETIPFSTGLNVGYQFTPFQKLTANYSFAYDVYFRHADTAEDFVVPNNTVTHGIGIAYAYSRHGYTLGASASGFTRGSWRAWGREPADPSTRDYRRYSLTASKDFFPGPFQTLHLGAAWYGGRDLDRFSMYQFGLFSPVRMHGVPAAGVRFRELALARVSYAFNVFEQYRLDLFFDQAAGRDPDARDQWRHVAGTGVAVNFRAPSRTMLRIDVGKGFLPGRYRAAGSLVLQVLLLKPL